MTLKVKLLRPGARLPLRATEGSAGYDLSACIDAPLTLRPGEIAKIGTGIAAETPPGSALFVFGRSGLGARGVTLANAVGVVDGDYRGELTVALINHGQHDYTVAPGERIAQAVLMPVLTPPVEQAAALSETGRGAGGYGSTGDKA